jgi:DNA invertase Pin-like site-specific DNA recombinase
MSTDEQQYSTDNQRAAIQQYADRYGFRVVATYTDSGRSGVVLKRRAGLLNLLKDVVGGGMSYRAILVYDVSRWGRFQDADESAHYEFLCKQAGVRVHYCSEPFTNDNALSNSILKAIKRSMAAEYSRELGVKVLEGKKRLVMLGVRVGGAAGFGLRRMMVSKDGRRKQLLQRNEYKNLQTDRVILVPGPKKEVKWVRTIFDMAAKKRMRPLVIARVLNHEGLTNQGLPWSITSVTRLLTNPKYCGCNAWNRTSQRLQTTRIRQSEEFWVLRPGAFVPIIDSKTFQRVQNFLRKRRAAKPESLMLGQLKRLLQREGRLSSSLIDHQLRMSWSATYWKRFGSLRKAYDAIGYEVEPSQRQRALSLIGTCDLITKLVSELTSLFPGQIGKCHDKRQRRRVMLLDIGVRVTVLSSRHHRTRTNLSRWLLRRIATGPRSLTLVCLFNQGNTEFQSFYLVPCMDGFSRYKWLKENDVWFQEAVPVERLSDFYSAACTLAAKYGPMGLENRPKTDLAGRR